MNNATNTPSTATAGLRSVDRLVLRNRSHFKEYGIKPNFEWCEKCTGAEGCYPDGAGPNYLEPACWKGPMTNDEVSQNNSISLKNP